MLGRHHGLLHWHDSDQQARMRGLDSSTKGLRSFRAVASEDDHQVASLASKGTQEEGR